MRKECERVRESGGGQETREEISWVKERTPIKNSPTQFRKRLFFWQK